MAGKRALQCLRVLLLLGFLLLSQGWKTDRDLLADTALPFPSVTPAMAYSQGQTLADRHLQAAQTLLRYLPDEVDGYNELATACLLKSRETGDFSYAAKAGSALQQSLQLDSDNGEALKLQLVLLLTEHRFQEALNLARQLQSHFSQDPEVEAALIDALVELGDYAAANARVQALLDLHPSAPAYARLSYLRSLRGDQSGAIASMRRAVQVAHLQDREGLAWYHVHLGIEMLNAGRWAAGEQELDQALQVFPEYPLALAAKARARLTARDWDQAVAFYRRAEEQMPLPDTAIALGNLYLHLGNQTAARQQYDLVDFLVQAGGEPFRKAYAHQLVLFWADQGTHLEEALALIQQERLTRSDIYTFDALAWCLFKLSQNSEAKSAIDQALRLGTPDARIYYHAGLIYHNCGKNAKAARFLQQALQINPVFHPLQAEIARQTLATIAPT